MNPWSFNISYNGCASPTANPMSLPLIVSSKKLSSLDFSSILRSLTLMEYSPCPLLKLFHTHTGNVNPIDLCSSGKVSARIYCDHDRCYNKYAGCYCHRNDPLMLFEIIFYFHTFFYSLLSSVIIYLLYKYIPQNLFCKG